MTSTEPTQRPTPEAQRPPFVRAIIIGIVAQVVTFVWVADSEIKQSVYLICYSLLMPAVVVLLSLLVMNQALVRIRPNAALRPQEMAIVYIMLTCSLPLAGFGGLRFILPTMGLPFCRTTPDNWGRFIPYLPAWLVPHDSALWRGFFRGGQPPWAQWFLPLLFWCGFLLALAGLWLSLSALLRRRWIEQERLTFPIVYLPLQITVSPRSFFGSPIMWAGLTIPAVLQSLLALNHLYPTVPAVQLKAWDASIFFPNPPWNAIGYLPIGLYPTAVGLAFFIPTDISFSCWAFYLLTKGLNVAGATAGYDMTGATAARIRFPYPQEQAAGAWIALGLLALAAVMKTPRPYRGATGIQQGLVNPKLSSAAEDSSSGRGQYLLSSSAPLGVGGLAHSPLLFAATAWLLAVLAGVPAVAATIMLGGYALYVVCGARVRAEVGAQWTFPPLVWTPTQTAIHALGSASMGDRGLVMASLFEAQDVDMRGQTLPNQLEGFKLADALAIPARQVTRVIILATVMGVVLAAVTSLQAWYSAGAATAKANVYALDKSRLVWKTLAGHFDSRAGPDLEGLTAAGVGAAITLWLARMRVLSLAWPLHPIGYVLANTLTVNAFLVPFMLAWTSKTIVRRWGGIPLYRQAVLFFVGVILGDILAQSLWTIAGRLIGFPVYQFLS